MNNKFSKKKLRRMIDSGFTDLSSEDIKKLIEIEISKGVENTDTDYIDLCFKLLAIREKQVVSISHKKNRVRTLLVAAIVLIFMFSVITVSAYVFDFNVPNSIAQLINNDAYVDINLEYADTTADGYQLTGSDLAKELEDHGVTPVTFPEELLAHDCKIVSIEYPETDKTVNIVANINFEYRGCYGRFTITQFVNDIYWLGENTHINVISGQMLRVNGMDILVFEYEDSCSVEYKDNCTEYRIFIECDIDTVINFTKSIK